MVEPTPKYCFKLPNIVSSCLCTLKSNGIGVLSRSPISVKYCLVITKVDIPPPPVAFIESNNASRVISNSKLIQDSSPPAVRASTIDNTENTDSGNGITPVSIISWVILIFKKDLS